MPPPQVEIETDCLVERPKLQVTRHEFRQFALAAGWEPATIEMFLNRKAPVRKYVQVGHNDLKVIEWE